MGCLTASKIIVHNRYIFFQKQHKSSAYSFFQQAIYMPRQLYLFSNNYTKCFLMLCLLCDAPKLFAQSIAISIVQSHAKYRFNVFIEFLSSTFDFETMSKLSTVDMTSGIERILKTFSLSLFSERTITVSSSGKRKTC